MANRNGGSMLRAFGACDGDDGRPGALDPSGGINPDDLDLGRAGNGTPEATGIVGEQIHGLRSGLDLTPGRVGRGEGITSQC